MLFKKKEEPVEETEEITEEEKPLTPLQIKFLQRLKTIGDKAEMYERYNTQKIITQAEYRKEMDLLMKELDDVARAINNDSFDELMGRPTLLFPQIFGDDPFDFMVHQAIEDVEDESNTCD